MTIKKIIQEELGKTLEEHGFKFTKAEPCFWPYEREKDGIRQEIVVARDRYEKGYIKMIFSTNAYGCWLCVKLGIITQTQEETIFASSSATMI